MKIKRFEASNMTEALQKIKKEFGEEAVILSAKSTKKLGGFFSNNGSKVVVTAAIDMAPTKKGKGSSDQNLLHDQNKNDGKPMDEVEVKEVFKETANNIFKQYQPITKTGLHKVQPKLFRLMADHPNKDNNDRQGNRSLYDNLRVQGLSPAIANDLSEQISQLIPSGDINDPEVFSLFAQVIDAKGWIASNVSAHSEKSRPVILVGPHGAGKTATAAKIAAEAVMRNEPMISMMSWDQHRVAGYAELERYAHVMGIRLWTIQSEDELSRIIANLSPSEKLVVDTYGIELDNFEARDALGRMIEIMGDVEIHLVMNGCMQEQILSRTIDFFKPLGVNRFLFTQLDNTLEKGHIFNLIEANDIPVKFICNSAKVHDGLCSLNSIMAAKMLMPDQVHQDMDVTVVSSRNETAIRHSHPFVANRNSDIFHQTDCKSVKRIHHDNIVTFRDSEQAIGKGFKPCRMCCFELMNSKPIDRLIHRRWSTHR